MIRAEGTVEKGTVKRSMRSRLAALSLSSAARALLVGLITAVLVFVTGDALGRVWSYVAIVGAGLLVMAMVYFALRFVQRNRRMATSYATLQSNAELFQVAFDFAAIGMALVFPNGRCQRVNRSLCEILGYTDEELLATDFQDFVHPDERITARTKWE